MTVRTTIWFAVIVLLEIGWLGFGLVGGLWYFGFMESGGGDRAGMVRGVQPQGIGGGWELAGVRGGLHPGVGLVDWRLLCRVRSCTSC